MFVHIPLFNQTFGLLFLLAALWTIFWKGWALWLAARREEKIWFVILLLVNTLGILDIIYIFAIADQKDHKTVPPPHDPNNSGTQH